MFSILIPTFNNLKYLKVCIESIKKNSKFIHQIIVHINEGSDGTIEYVKNLGIDYTFSENNIGMPKALNLASKKARQNYILISHDDFYYCPGWDQVFYEEIKNLKHKKTKTVKKTLNLHSTTFSNFKERNSTFLVGGWHGQWSKFYFFKKNYGYITALRKCLPNNLINLIQILIFIIFDPAKAKYKYFKLEGFLCSLFGLPAFKRSLYDKQNLY